MTDDTKTILVVGHPSARNRMLRELAAKQVEVFRWRWAERQRYLEHQAYVADAGAVCHCDRPDYFKWLEGG